MIAQADGVVSGQRIPLGRWIKAKPRVGFRKARTNGVDSRPCEVLLDRLSAEQNPVTKRSRPLIYAPLEKHMLTIAPTGAGKFRSVLVPELLTYPGPIVCLDIKGEAYAVTARRRREMGHRVVRLDPFHVVGPSTDSLNFFDLFSLKNADLETDAQMIASILSDGSSLSRDPFWDISARGLVAGCIVYLAHHRDKADQILKSLRELVYADDTDYKLAVLLDTIKTMHPLARGEIAAYLSMPDRETRPSVLATVRSYFKALFSQRVETAFNQSTFSLCSLADSEPMTIYLVVPPNKLESHRRMIRLWVTTLMAAITARRHIPDIATLFLIDEASQLGNFPPMVQAITLGRGYGVRVHSFWQDLSQLMLCYPTEWRTVINNCGVKQIFGMTDPFMAHGLDELFQVPMKELTSISNKQQWLLRNGVIQKAGKMDYLRDAEFAGLFDANPYHGGSWPRVASPEIPQPPVENVCLRDVAEQSRSENNDDKEKGASYG